MKMFVQEESRSCSVINVGMKICLKISGFEYSLDRIDANNFGGVKA